MEHYHLAVCGCDPASLSPLIYMEEHGKLDELIQLGLCIIDESDSIGTGNIGKYHVSANSLGKVFTEIFQNPDSQLYTYLKQKDSFKKLDDYLETSPPLTLVGEIMKDIGVFLGLEVKKSTNSNQFTSSRVTKIKRLKNKQFEITIQSLLRPNSPRMITSNHVLLNMGGMQLAPRFPLKESLANFIGRFDLLKYLSRFTNGSFLLKCLLSLINFSLVTKQSQYNENIHNCFEQYASFQKPAGNFTSNSGNNTFLHPHLYTLEAFWSYGVISKKIEYIHIAKLGVDWILGRFNTIGYCGYIDANGNPLLDGIGSDALSQIIRLMALMSYPNHVISQLVTLLIDQYYIENTSGHGCFKYGYIIENKWKNDQNCWSSMFAHQALDLFVNDSCRRLLHHNPTYII